MSMSNNQAKEPIVYFRKKIRKTKRIEQVVGTVVASPAHQDFLPKKVGQKSFETLHKSSIKLFEEEKKCVDKKETKTKSGTKCSYSSKSNTRLCKGGGARNAKISDNKEERRKTWNPQTSVFNKYMEILTTEEETNWNELALVDGNIDYVSSQLEFAKDLGETAQRFALTKVCSLKKSLNSPPIFPNTYSERFDAKIRKAKMVHQENQKIINFEDFYAQRRSNKGINISEKIVNSREEVTKLLGTNSNQSSGLKLQFQNMTIMNQQQQHTQCDPTSGVWGGWGVRKSYAELYGVETSMNQVSDPNYFLGNHMKEQNTWPRTYKPRAIVHPSKIISPCKNSDQNMQRTSGSASSFSFMKLLMGDENCSILTEELNAKQQFLSPSWVQQPQQISFMDLLTREDHELEMFDLDSTKHDVF
ncbi:uncharacterized protein LOC142182581 [Nicotiana tabacum]|uniref:Uncharacterized protein LOC142182581 n=1 Tax=Nicotiana tabacum TaxID=4097 RepID=A0AC58UTR7_TOBAC